MKQAQRHLIALAALAAGLFSGGNAFAVTNGDFTVSLAGWDAVGDASVQSSVALLTSAYDAGDDASGNFNFSGNPAVDTQVDGLETLAGLNANALGNAWDGSLIKQTFTVNAGDTLSFQWNFLSNEVGAEFSQPDFAFVVINGALTQLGGVAQATLSPGLNGFAAQTGWNTFSQTFANADTVTLALGVVDVNDTVTTSALMVDQVTLSAVPEPGALMLLGAGMVFSGWSQRRRRG